MLPFKIRMPLDLNKKKINSNPSVLFTKNDQMSDVNLVQSPVQPN